MPMDNLSEIRNEYVSRFWLRNLAFALFICMGAFMITESFAAEPAPPQDQSPNLRSVPVALGSKTILAKVAEDDSSRMQGLLGWTSINDEAGMLLAFALESKYAIHMQGMKFPIDAIWIDSKGEIKLIYEDIPPNSGQVYPSLFPCRYCLEVKAGFCKKFGVKMGQKVSFGGNGK